MKTVIEFDGPYGRVAIPANLITGIAETGPGARCMTFVATGADNADGGENGWYINTPYTEAVMLLREALENNDACGNPL